MKRWHALLRIIGLIATKVIGFEQSQGYEKLGGQVVVVVGLAVFGFVIAGPLAGLIAASIAIGVVVRRSNAERMRRLDEIRRALPEIVGLLGVASSAGLNPHRSIQVVADVVKGPMEPLIAEAGLLARAGYTAGECLSAIAEKTELDEFRSLARAFAASERQGAPLAPSLRRLGRDLSEQRRRRAEAAARKAPIRVLFPLVICILPAFVLLAVVPMLVETFNIVNK